jgi:hypothetical protein
MIRLLVGIYPLNEAKAHLDELAAEIPEAFMLQDGQMASVFAGSFRRPAEARKMAQKLTKLNIRAAETPALVPMTLQRVTFGRFADRQEAQAALEKARSAGLDPVLVKLPLKP